MSTDRPQLAGWWRRAGAFLIDGLVIAIPSFIVARRLNGTTTERVSVNLLFIFGGIAYGALPDQSAGEDPRECGPYRSPPWIYGTVGKSRWEQHGFGLWSPSLFLGSVSEILFLYGATQPPGWSSHSHGVTGLVSVIGLLLYLTFLLPIRDPRNQTLQDKAAGSVVICERRSHPGWRSWSSF